jgi:hypothetical protein
VAVSDEEADFEEGVAHVGDVFAIPIDDDRVGFGYVVGEHPGLDLHVAVFGAAHARDSTPPLEEIVKQGPAFLAHTTDTMIRYGRWWTVGNVEPAAERWPVPAYRMHHGGPHSDEQIWDYELERHRAPRDAEELERALRPISYAPQKFQRALQALHGIGDWEDEFEELRFSRAASAATLTV